MKPIVSTNKELLDISFIYNFLSRSYWANKRTLEQVKKSINNSRCYGMYLDDQQIGFARLITDKVVFLYIMDVFIIESKQGKGYSKILMETMLKDPELQGVGKWYLRTRDAHGLYEKFGFMPLEKPSMSMEKVM